MDTDYNDLAHRHEIIITDEIKSFIKEHDSDYRVCTSCGGPILLSIAVKPPKSTDIEYYVGEHTIYVSVYQAPFIDIIDMDMVPLYYDRD